MFEFQSVRRSFPRNLAENSEAASFLGQTTSYKTEVQEREPWVYEWITCNEKPRCAPNIFPRNVLAGNINRWKNITADGLFRKKGTTTICIWKHWNNLMVNNCSKRHSNWEIDMIEWVELKSKLQWKRNIQLASISNY